jgi:hypothetical protein
MIKDKAFLFSNFIVFPTETPNQLFRRRHDRKEEEEDDDDDDASIQPTF